MKKIKVLFWIVLSGVLLTGCYDMVDIENIKEIFALDIGKKSEQYYAVSPSEGKNAYGTQFYAFSDDTLEDAKKEIGTMTGKKIDFSHLNIVLISEDTSFKKIKKYVKMLIDENEIHKKVYVAIYDKNVKEYISNKGKDGLYKYLQNVIANKFADIQKCGLSDFYYSLYYNSSTSYVPLFTMSSNDKLTEDGVYCFNDTGKYYLSKSDFKLLTGCKMKYNMNNNLMVTDSKEAKKLIDKAKEKGYDIANMKKEIKKEFCTEKSFLNYVKEKGGYENMIKNIKVVS